MMALGDLISSMSQNLFVRVKVEMQPKPILSFIIVARNAAKFIDNLLDDYLHQDYPPEKRELIFVDGASDDETKAKVQAFANLHPELVVTILDNPKRTLAPGWNQAIRAARGDIVCRVDAHGSIPPDYLRKGVTLLQQQQDPKVVCVGGPLQTMGRGFVGEIIAAVLSSPFGVGNSRFRCSKKPGFVDTVPFGFYWRWIFDEIGFFREDLDRNQDIELHSRIRSKGYKFYISPELITTYFCRSNIKDFIKQAFGNGYWVMITWRQSYWRHFVPFIFVSGLLILFLIGLLWSQFHMILLLLMGLYFGFSYYFTFRNSFKLNRFQKLIMPFFFLMLHITYGLGSCWAILNGKSYLK